MNTYMEFLFFRARCQQSTDGGQTCPVIPRDNLTDVNQKGNQCNNDPNGRMSKVSGSYKRVFEIKSWHALCCVCVGVNAVAIPITIFVVPWLVG